MKAHLDRIAHFFAEIVKTVINVTLSMAAVLMVAVTVMTSKQTKHAKQVSKLNSVPLSAIKGNNIFISSFT